MLSVVAFHAFPEWIEGGFIGVDVFFVISGYLISRIIFENLENGTFSFSEFYSRRVTRIFPALLLVLTACLFFGWIALLPDEYEQLGKHILGGVGFASNLVFWSEAGYFDNSAETKVLLHLWSLGIEEQFYLIWPLLLWAAWRYKRNILLVTALCAVVSFALNLRSVGQNTIATFYSPQTRFWELLCGSLLAWFYLYGKEFTGKCKAARDGWLKPIISYEGAKPQSRPFSMLSVLGLLLLGYGFWRIDKSMSFPGSWAVAPVLGTVLIIYSGPAAWLNSKILSNRFVVWFGLVSFPLYLWHWPLLSLARIVEGEVPSQKIRMAAVVLSIALAWLTYRFVERPVRQGGHGQLKVAGLVALMLGIGCAGFFVYSKEGLKFRANIVEITSINAEFVGPNWRFAKNDICQSKYPFADTDKYSWWFCMASSEEKPTLLILGNSYANHLYAGFVLNDEFKHHSVLSIGTCEPAWVEKYDSSTNAPSSPCFGERHFMQQEFINDIVAKEKSIRYAIINSRHDIKDDYAARLKKRIDFLENHNIKVILFSPHPRLGYDIKGCYTRPFKKTERTCQAPAENYADTMKKFNGLANTLAKTNPNVLIFDQNSVLCDAHVCRFKLPVMPAFRDEYYHYSEFASKLVIKEFANWAKIHAPDIVAP